jgi:hypothetical protein
VAASVQTGKGARIFAMIQIVIGHVLFIGLLASYARRHNVLNVYWAAALLAAYVAGSSVAFLGTEPFTDKWSRRILICVIVCPLVAIAADRSISARVNGATWFLIVFLGAVTTATIRRWRKKGS